MKKLVLLLLFVPTLAHATPNWGHGPITIYDQQPLALTRLSLSPISPEVMEEGKYSFEASFVWSNTLNFEPKKFLVDAETRTANLNFAYSLTDNSEIHLHLPVVYRGEGVLDSTIDTWHQWFDLPRGNRDKIPDNQFIVSGNKDDGTSFNLRSKGTHLGNATIGLKHLLTAGDLDRPAVALLFQAQLPTGHSTFGQNGIDVLTGILASKRWGAFSLYSGLSYTHYFKEKIENLDYQKHQAAGFLTGEYEISENWSGQISLIGRSKLIDKLGDYPNHSLYLDIGTSTQVSENSRLKLLLRENPSDRNSTTDVAFLVAIEYK